MQKLSIEHSNHQMIVEVPSTEWVDSNISCKDRSPRDNWQTMPHNSLAWSRATKERGLASVISDPQRLAGVGWNLFSP